MLCDTTSAAVISALDFYILKRECGGLNDTTSYSASQATQTIALGEIFPGMVMVRLLVELRAMARLLRFAREGRWDGGSDVTLG
jgi:hypothetical protein